ncbi:RHS repeat-associated core domain-containing protein [Acidovorax sp. LjRoot117]|uniref:RHS repeat-associated core domain-containing protein n=1 Tax=Acidovorax sp. LjRoot117 TaxID=3342255 RepID=UPI003ECEB346
MQRPFLAVQTALILVAAVLLPAPAQSQPISQSVRLPNQEYTESRRDIAVKVLGGEVAIERTWTGGRWYLNPAWSNLRLIPDPLGGVLAVQRAGSLYERTGSQAGQSAGSIYRFDANNLIAQTATGWRWYDRLGHSVYYDASGVIQRYEDPNGVQVSFGRDASGQINTVNDHHGRAALSLFSDSEGRVTRVSDSTGRSVSYQWSGSGADSQLSQVTDLLGQRWKYDYNGQGQLTRRTNPEGGQLNITYLSSPAAVPASSGFAGTGAGSGAGVNTGGGATPNVGVAFSGQTKAPLPPVARVSSIQDEGGATTLYRVEYDRVRQQYTITSQDPTGASRRRVYNKTGLLLQDSTNDQMQSQRIVDSVSQERSIDARGQTTTTQYDTARQPLQITYPDGSRESYQYDAQGRTVRHTNTLGAVSTWAYDAKGREVEHTEALGQPEQRTTRSTYDPWGQPTRRTRGAGNGLGPDTVATGYEYDSAGNLVRTTNALGHSASATYNSQGQPLTQTNPLGQTSTYTWDAAGHLLGSTNPLAQTTRHSYDSLGRRTQSTSSEGRTRQTVYDAAGRVVEQRQPGQATGTKVSYDAAGRAAATTSPGGLISTSAYDALGRITQTTDPAGNTTRYEYGAAGTPLAGLLTATIYPTYIETYRYDQRGRQTQTIQNLDATASSGTPATPANSRTQHQAYDAQGQRISSTDPAGNSTLYRYDALGRLVETIDSLNQSTKQSWDAQDQLVAVTDANGNTHRFDYDKAGRLTKETRPMGGAIQYSYDAAGQLTQRTDAGGNTRSYAYDAAGRITLEEHRLQGSQLDQRIGRQYDKDGLLASYEQQDGAGRLISSASYTKDAQGSTTQSAITYGKVDAAAGAGSGAGSGAGTFSFTIGQGFNADGQLQSHTYPDGSQQAYTYDKGRLAQVTLPDQSRINYLDYQWMQPTRIQTPGAAKTQTFDALQRHTRIEVRNNASQLLASKNYQYDLAGNITQIDSDLGNTQYGYDKLSRLTQAAPDNNLKNLGLPLEQYSYDPVGNRTSSGHQPGMWSYNGDNQLVQYPRTTPFSGAPAQNTQVTYTAQGHTQNEKSGAWQRDYRYNAAERLIETSQNGQNTSYRYDPFGRRISKSIGSARAGAGAGPSTTTYYLYSDTGLMAETDGQGQLIKAYGFNPKAAQQGLWSTDPIWQADVTANSLTSTSTSYHYLHTDHLATPTLATDKTGSTTWKGASEAFGATTTTIQAIDMNLRFPGQYWDGETQTHYNFNRDYMPGVGRYIQGDPLGLAGGNNFFAYANSNGTRYVDPQGKFGLVLACVANPACAFVGLVIIYEGCKAIINNATMSSQGGVIGGLRIPIRKQNGRWCIKFVTNLLHVQCRVMKNHSANSGGRSLIGRLAVLMQERLG